jgi:hypothetical protein
MQPNLLIVMPDQMRMHQLGFLKEEQVKTPRLDSFADNAGETVAHLVRDELLPWLKKIKDPGVDVFAKFAEII